MTKIRIEISLPSHLKQDPILYEISTKYKLIPNIIEASFSTSQGWAILTLEGDQTEIDKLLDYLKSKDITVKKS